MSLPGDTSHRKPSASDASRGIPSTNPAAHARLTVKVLLPHGRLGRLGRQVVIFDEIDSTNAYLLAHAAELPDGTIASAEHQTAGRGRLGRRWESPRGSAILLSVLLHESADSLLIGRATMCAAVAACEAVEQTTPCRPVVRWPNDLMLSGRKLGGVLVESTSLSSTTKDRTHTPATSAAQRPRRRAVVIGIGLNCLQQRGHFHGDLAGSATSLEIESRQPIDRAAVARTLLERLDTHLSVPARGAPADDALASWKARCADFGARVRLRQDRRTHSGTVLEVAENGDLLVQLDEGGRRYFASATTTRLT